MRLTALSECPDMTTRRRVLKTGAKLVYAAPVVIASMQVNRSGVSAQQLVSGPIGVGEVKAKPTPKPKAKPTPKPKQKPNGKPKK